MGYIGREPSVLPITSSDLPDSIVSNSKLGADSVNATKIADDSISEEHIDNTAITGFGALTSLADTDKFLVSDASDSGNLKYVEKQYLGGGAMTLIARNSGSSAVGNIGLDNIFSDTYDYYKIYAWINAQDDEGDLNFRWRKSGSDRTDSYYVNCGMASQRNSGGDSHYVKNSQWNADHFVFLNNLNENDNMGCNLDLTIYDPRARDEGNIATVQYSASNYRDDNIWVNVNGAGMYGNQGSGDDFDGFKIYISNSDILYYDYAIYGMNKT